MTALEILNEFKEIFPGKYPFVTSYKKVGSKTIKIWLTDDEKPLLFMYRNKEDWVFGTKIWHRKPGTKKRINEYIKHDQKVVKEVLNELKDEDKEKKGKAGK